MYDNQHTALSLHEDFGDIIQHNHLQYTNGKTSVMEWQKQNKNSKSRQHHSRQSKHFKTSEPQSDFKPVLTNTFKVHPLEAMNIQKYKKQTLLDDMLEKQEKLSQQQEALQRQMLSKQTSTNSINN